MADGGRYALNKRSKDRAKDPMSIYTETKGKDYYDTTMRKHPSKRSKKIAKR